MPQLPIFQYQPQTEPVSTQPETVTEDRWHQPWSDPTRRKGPTAALMAASGPSFNGNPVISIDWFEGLSEPKRFKKGGPPTEQPFAQFFPPSIAAILSWFEALSEPKRFRRRLLEADQEFLARGSFIPTSYTASLDTTDQRDLFLGILSQFNIPFSAYVDIIENDPTKLGNLGIIENVAQSSIVASIVEPETVPSTGTAIATVAGARVAIIVS